MPNVPILVPKILEYGTDSKGKRELMEPSLIETTVPNGVEFSKAVIISFVAWKKITTE